MTGAGRLCAKGGTEKRTAFAVRFQCLCHLPSIRDYATAGVFCA
jgi:hypothetical protein